jgi:tRNA pseudouridine38-40 synthase
MPRYLIEVAYNGMAFNGSQVQNNGKTVQGDLDWALSKLLRTPICTYGSSRTDQGVHALSNYFHVDINQAINANELLYRLNGMLDHHLAIKSIQLAPHPAFNVRFDALSRTYLYKISTAKNPFALERMWYFPYKIDTDLLHQSAAQLLHHTDYQNFCKKHSQNKTTICQIKKAEWHIENNEIHFIVEANRFLRGMVRALVATQLELARGQISWDTYMDILNPQSNRLAYFHAPGWGLYLVKVLYPQMNK